MAQSKTTEYVTAKQYISKIYYEIIRSITKDHHGVLANTLRNTAMESAKRDLFGYVQEMGYKTFKARLMDKRDGLDTQEIFRRHVENLKDSQDLYVVLIGDLFEKPTTLFTLIEKTDKKSESDNLSELESQINSNPDIKSTQEAWEEYYGYAD